MLKSTAAKHWSDGGTPTTYELKASSNPNSDLIWANQRDDPVNSTGSIGKFK